MIAAACRDGERLRFAYRRRDGTETPARGRAALAGQPRAAAGTSSPGTAGARTGAASASTASTRPPPTGVRFARARCPATDPAAFVRASITGAPNRHEARVTLRAPAQAMARRVPAQWGTIKPIDAETLRVPHRRRRPRWLALRVAMLGVDFEVHEPPELLEHLQALADRLERAVRP